MSTTAAPAKMTSNGRKGESANHQPTIMTATTAMGGTDSGDTGRPTTRRGYGTWPEPSTATSTLSMKGMTVTITTNMVNVKAGEERGGEGRGRG